MHKTFVKRLGLKVLDATLAPLLRYTFNSIAPQLAAQIENAVARSSSQYAETLSAATSEFNQHALRISSQLRSSASEQRRTVQPLLRKEIAELRARLAIETPNNPSIHGFKVYAQTDEDGIIENILARLPGHSRTFIEIGCGTGVENNTHYLALKGYRGCWVDGSNDNIAFIKNALGGQKFDDLIIQHQFVARDNIRPIIDGLAAFVGTTEPGFFSLDIDGNEFDVLAEALKAIRPLVICIEYNAKFPPPHTIAMRYDASHSWAGDDYHGASLQALCNLLAGYKLVACNLSGVNAFFVRSDHATEFADYTPRQLYQPFREELIDLRAEHPPSLKWLREKLR